MVNQSKLQKPVKAGKLRKDGCTHDRLLVIGEHPNEQWKCADCGEVGAHLYLRKDGFNPSNARMEVFGEAGGCPHCQGVFLHRDDCPELTRKGTPKD